MIEGADIDTEDPATRNGWVLWISDVDPDGCGAGPDAFDLTDFARLGARATHIAVYGPCGVAATFDGLAALATAGDRVLAVDTQPNRYTAWRAMLAVIAPYARLLDLPHNQKETHP